MNQADLDSFLGQLEGPGLCYFPIRHHSPTCARQLVKLIRRRAPTKILIEGPSDLTPFIPLLLDKEAQYPLAFYTTFQETSDARHAAYYPLCDYSPELVALQEGHRIGADLAFIDAPHAQRILRRGAGLEPSSARVISLLGQANLRRGRYIEALCEKLRCQDFDDFWDHMVESRGLESNPTAFVQMVATYAWLSRQSYSNEELELQGTLERERVMAKAIGLAQTEQSPKDLTLVVTGAFHVAGLIEFLQRQYQGEPGAFPSPKDSIKDAQIERYLIPYSFERLDSMHGYSAGMPAPAYYQELWRRQDSPNENALDKTALSMLLQLVRETRSKRTVQLSSADLIAAMNQAKGLAELRGRPGPCRQDLVDAVKSCFIKGLEDSEGLLIHTIARHTLQGQRVGKTPSLAKRPPIIDDFYRALKDLGLQKTGSLRQEKRFDIYRDKKDRARSRFAHKMAFLARSYAEKIAGPDWAANQDMRRLFEVWRLGWSPDVETELLDASTWGSDLRSAAHAKLQAQFHPEDPMFCLGSHAAVLLMIQACEMGLHASLPDLLNKIAPRIANDANLGSLVRAMQALTLARKSWEPLEVHLYTQLDNLISQCFERSCFLLPELAHTDYSEDLSIVDQLASIAHHLDAPDQTLLDPGLFYNRLLPLALGTKTDPLVRGATTGLLVQEGLLSPERMHQQITSALDNASYDTRALDALYALLVCHPAVAHTEPFFVEAIDTALRNWDEQTFLRAIPQIRLAMTALSPRELHRLSQRVAQRYETTETAFALRSPLDAETLKANIVAEQQLRSVLDQDGLQDWT